MRLGVCSAGGRVSEWVSRYKMSSFQNATFLPPFNNSFALFKCLTISALTIHLRPSLLTATPFARRLTARRARHARCRQKDPLRCLRACSFPAVPSLQVCQALLLAAPPLYAWPSLLEIDLEGCKEEVAHVQAPRHCLLSPTRSIPLSSRTLTPSLIALHPFILPTQYSPPYPLAILDHQ